MKNRIAKEPLSGTRAEADEPLAETSTELLVDCKHALQRVENLITTHPLAGLAVAAAAGISIGWWVKRK